METVIEQAYLEQPQAGGRAFVHVTLRDCNHTYAVEEVVGTVDLAGKRRGEIRSVCEGAPLDDARRTFRARIAEREQSGYQPARI